MLERYNFIFKIIYLKTLRKIIKKIETSNWYITPFLLAFSVIIAIILRYPGLGDLPFYADEQLHTHQALDLLRGQPLSYTRSFIPVTAPVFLSFWLLGVSWLKARLPMILLNALGVIPLYFLGKKVSTTTAWAAVI